LQLILLLSTVCAQSRHREGALVGLTSQNKAPSPKIETRNVNQWSFCQFLECQAPPHKRKSPLLNCLATVLSLLLIHLLPTRSPILAKWNKSTYVRSGMASSKFWAGQMLTFGEHQYFVCDTLLNHKMT